jgi:uncharacterized membrane protein YgaE (UPF0421/DUF939 family)
MQQSIAWHEKCLANMTQYLKDLNNEYHRVLKQHDDLLAQITFYNYQIEVAKKEQKAKFDDEKYLVKRK